MISNKRKTLVLLFNLTIHWQIRPVIINKLYRPHHELYTTWHSREKSTVLTHYELCTTQHSREKSIVPTTQWTSARAGNQGIESGMITQAVVVAQVKDFIRALTSEANTSNLHLKASAAFPPKYHLQAVKWVQNKLHRENTWSSKQRPSPNTEKLCHPAGQECHHILAISSLLPLEINPRLQKSLVFHCYSLFCFKVIIKLSIKPMVTLNSLNSCCLSPKSAGTAGMSHIAWLLQVFCIKYHLS